MRRLIATFGLACALLVSGCAGTQPTYAEDTAAELQQQVLTVSEASAAGDFEAAMTRLDELVVLLNDALARGTITPERQQSILSAIELVRADLAAAIAAQQPPPPAPEPAPAPDNSGTGNGDKGNGDEGNGNGNDGDGDDDGNGNGNKDKGRDKEKDD